MNKRISKKKVHMLYNNERKFMYRFTHDLLPSYNEQIANKYVKFLLKKSYGAKTFTDDEAREICNYIRRSAIKGYQFISTATVPIGMNKEIKEGEVHEV